jgi:hypothetical protein
MWRAQRADADRRSGELDKQIKDLRDANAKKQDQQDQVRKAIATLKNDFVQVELTSARLKSLYDDAMGQLEALKAERSKLASDAGRLSSRVDAANKQAGGLKVAIKSLDDEIERLRKQAQESEMRTDAMSAETVAQMESSGKLRGDMAAMRVQLNLDIDEDSKAIADTEAHIVSLKAEVHDLSTRRNNTLEEIANAQKEHARLQALREKTELEAQALAMEITALQAKFQSASDERRSAQEHAMQIAQQQEEAEEEDKMNSAKADALEDEAALVDRILARNRATVLETSGQLDALSGRRESLLHKLEELGNATSSLRTKKERLSHLHEELKANATYIQQELDTLRTQLSGALIKVKEMEAMAEKHRSEADREGLAERSAKQEVLGLSARATLRKATHIKTIAEGLMGYCDCTQDSEGCDKCGPHVAGAGEDSAAAEVAAAREMTQGTEQALEQAYIAMSPSPSPSNSPSATPSVTPSSTPSMSASASPSPSPSESASPSPSASPMPPPEDEKKEEESEVKTEEEREAAAEAKLEEEEHAADAAEHVAEEEVTKAEEAEHHASEGEEHHAHAEESHGAEEETKEASVEHHEAEHETKEASVEHHEAEHETKEASVEHHEAEHETKEASVEHHEAEHETKEASEESQGAGEEMRFRESRVSLRSKAKWACWWHHHPCVVERQLRAERDNAVGARTQREHILRQTQEIDRRADMFMQNLQQEKASWEKRHKDEETKSNVLKQAAVAARERMVAVKGDMTRIEEQMKEATKGLEAASAQVEGLQFFKIDTSEKRDSQRKTTERLSANEAKAAAMRDKAVAELAETRRVALEQETKLRNEYALLEEKLRKLKAELSNLLVAADGTSSQLRVAQEAREIALGEERTAQEEVDASVSERDERLTIKAKAEADISAAETSTHEAKDAAEASRQAIAAARQNIEHTQSEMRRVRAKLEHTKAAMHASEMSHALSFGDSSSVGIAVRKLQDSVAAKEAEADTLKARLVQMARESEEFDTQVVLAREARKRLSAEKDSVDQKLAAARAVAEEEERAEHKAHLQREVQGAERDMLAAKRGLVARTPLEQMGELLSRRRELEGLVGGERAEGAQKHIDQNEMDHLAAAQEPTKAMDKVNEILSEAEPAEEDPAQQVEDFSKEAEQELGDSPADQAAARVEADQAAVAEAVEKATISAEDLPANSATGDPSLDASLGMGPIPDESTAAIPGDLQAQEAQ